MARDGTWNPQSFWQLGAALFLSEMDITPVIVYIILFRIWKF